MNRTARARTSIVCGAAAALVLSTPALSAYANDDDYDDGRLKTVASGLEGPRGVAALGRGNTLVTEADGTFSLVVEGRKGSRTVKLGRIPTEFAPAIDRGRDGHVYILTGEAEPGSTGSQNARKLFVWKPGWSKVKVLADIGAYQARDTDPYDLEKKPEDSNPFGVEALDDGTVLVADAAGNDLLRVYQNGGIQTVARLKPRMVKVPAGLGKTDPEGKPLPKAGTVVPSEAVATSVTVGSDGYWYVGELRGFPATPGTSQVWRIRPGSVNAVCDPAVPDTGDCRRYADGLTSIVDLAANDKGSIFALSISKLSWLRMEMRTPGAEIGGLFEIKRYYDRDRHHDYDRARYRDHDRYDRDWNRDWDRKRYDECERDDRWRDREDDNWRERSDESWRDREDDSWRERGDESWRERGDESWRDRHDNCERDDYSRDRNGDRYGDRYDNRDRDRYGDRYGDRDHDRYRDHDSRYDDDIRTYIRELVAGQLRQPGGVDVDPEGEIYLVGPVFGPGALTKLDD